MLPAIPTAIAAFALHSGAFVGEDLRGVISSVERGQWDAGASLGLTRAHVMLLIVLPQALRAAVPTLGTRFIGAMKETSLASVVTVVELTRVGEKVGSSSFRYLKMFVIVAAIYWGLSFLIARLQVRLEARLAFRDATAEKACLFFAAVGGYVLNQSYKIRARIVGGAFCFCLGDGGGEVATFGKLEDGQLVSGPDAFHVWLQTDTHIIDFMAPIYREAFADHPRSADLPRKMMQRRLDEEAPDLEALVHTGDFRYYPDPTLTDKLLDDFLAKRFNGDLINIAMAWYGKRRARQVPTFAMQDEKGHVTRLSLATTVATCSW